MNAPAGMRPLKDIVADINAWVAANTNNATTPEAINCNKCSSIIQQVTLYASLHDSPFADMCAGGGEVENLALPYCPTCEPDVPAATQRTCIHTGGSA